jgi:transcriptional regulator with XRE-family HTH domain
MNVQRIVGLNVHRLRRARGPKWTQMKLAAEARISLVYVSEIERFLRDPSIGVMMRLAKALDVTVEDLIKPIPPGYVRPKDLPRGPNVHHQGRKRAGAK